jgi:hypothetical protein
MDRPRLQGEFHLVVHCGIAHKMPLFALRLRRVVGHPLSKTFFLSVFFSEDCLL